MAFHGQEIQKIKNEYAVLYEEFCSAKVKLKENYGDDKEKQRKLDLLRYQVNEIEEANLKIGEEEELDNIRSRMLNAEKISESLNEADIEIGDNAIEAISKAIRAMEKIDNLDTGYEERLSGLKSVYYDLQEIGRDINSFKEEIEFDEEERKNVETRLDLIFSLKRKYGNNIEEILKYNEDIKKEIEQIENLEEYRNNLKLQIENLEKDMFELAKKMNNIRLTNAEILSSKISNELSELEMKSATLKINVTFNNEKEFNKDGLDKVEFLIKTNTGEDFKPLIKIASGGEMSRIMLAIKNVLANVDKVPVLIFDEIDTGISGIAAKSVATKMKQIANNHQVLCVTHLAPIAASGDYNYFISKKVINEVTKTGIQLLNEEETIREIARIASGNVTEIALQHAKELRREKEKLTK
jgi:DNA repair protein RecN (Recombination protein N)